MKKNIKFTVIIINFLIFGLVFFPINVYALIDVTNQNTSVNAKAAVVMEASTGEILFGQNETEKLPMASTTKIMTALLTLEQPNLDEEFTVDSEAIKAEGSSMGLCEGDTVTLYNLAGGMLSASGNDAANAAAVKIAGNKNKFAEMMNERAKLINMKDTHFANPSGLPNDNHYSTAKDMAILGAVAMQNPKFKEISSKPYIQLNFGNPPYKRSLRNHNKLLKLYEGCVGVKTGFTDKAGRCLVSAVEKNGITLICVTLNCPDDWNTHTFLYNKYFNCVEKKTTVPINKLKLNVVGGMKNSITASGQGNVEYIVIKNNSVIKELTTKVYTDKFYYAPIKKGDIMGKVEYYKDDILISAIELRADEDVFDIKEEEKTLFQKILDFLRINE